MAVEYTETITCKITLAMKRRIDQFAREFNKENNKEAELSGPVRSLLEVGLLHYFDAVDEDKLESYNRAREEKKNPFQLQHESDLAINERILEQVYKVNGKEPISLQLLLSKGYKEQKYTERSTAEVKTVKGFGGWVNQTSVWIYNYGYQYHNKEKLVITNRE